MKRTQILPLVLAMLLLVLGFDYATFAATGDSLILGKSNKATKTTKIQRTTAGPVVTLRAKKAGNPPFATNGKGKVKNLNADKLDGVDSSTLGVRPLVFTKSSGSYLSPRSSRWVASRPGGTSRRSISWSSRAPRWG